MRQESSQPLLHPAALLGLGVKPGVEIANRLGLFRDPLAQRCHLARLAVVRQGLRSVSRAAS
jgi:hypothetical protein